MTAGWITLIGVAERNKRQKEACLPSRSLHLVGEGRPDYTVASVVPEQASGSAGVCKPQQGRRCEASVVNQENAGFHPGVCSLFICDPQRHQRLSLFLESLVGVAMAIEILAPAT